MKQGFFISVLLTLSIFTQCANAAQPDANPDTTDWFAYEVPKADDVYGTVLDCSDILDAPAGKHGFLTTCQDNKFYFEDGQQIKFFGVNMPGEEAYPTHEAATEAAKRIAQSGFNVVRIHLLDSGYNDGIWGRKANEGRVIRDETMDRTCFLISELKKRGIYVMVDQMISKPFSADDSLKDIEHLFDGAKEHGYYDRDLINMQNKYSEMLLEYYNPYTGMCLKDDPVMVFVGLKNEDTITNSDNRVSDYYDGELQNLFNSWLMEKYGSREALDATWNKLASDDYHAVTLQDDENPAEGTVRIPGVTDRVNYSTPRSIDSYKFLAEVQSDYFNERIDFLRGIGIKCLITGATSWASNGLERATFYSNTETDFIDTHHYVSNVSSTSYVDGMLRYSGPSVMSDDRFLSMVGGSNLRGVYGMPHVLTEWNDIAPNKYRAESLLLMTAYSALQGSNPFAFSWSMGGIYSESDGKTDCVKTAFGFADSPEYIQAMPVNARMYLRNDVKEAESGFYPERMQDDEPFGGLNQYINIYGREVNAFMGLIGKTGMCFDDKKYDEAYNDNRILQLAKKAYTNKTPFVSVTGEMSLDTADKVFRLNTQKTQAVSGFIQNQSLALNDIIITADNLFATVYFQSVDNRPLYNSQRMLLTVAGDSRNSGMEMSEDETTIIKAGSAPILIEPVTGNVVLKTKSNLSVYTLNSSGQRTGSKAVTKTIEGYSKFTLSAEDRAMNYEIVRSGTQSCSPNAAISLGNTAAENVFSDVDGEHKKEIERMALTECIAAKTGTQFRPSEQITKKDFIKLIVRALHLNETVWYDNTSSPSNDMATSDDGFGEMMIAYRLGAVTLRQGGWLTKKYYFDPNDTITREKAIYYASVLLPFAGRTRMSAEDYSLSQYSDYSTFINKYPDQEQNFRKIMGLGYIDPQDNKINADGAISREDAAVMVYRIAWK